MINSRSLRSLAARQCAATGAEDALQSSLALGIIALVLSWVGAIHGTALACRCACAVCGCGPCCSCNSQCGVATAHGFSWYLQASATVLWVVEYILLSINMSICSLANSSDYTSVTYEYNSYSTHHHRYRQTSRWTYMPFGFGVSASVLAAVGLVLHIPALLNAERAIQLRAERNGAAAAPMEAPAAVAMVPRAQRAPMMPPAEPHHHTAGRAPSAPPSAARRAYYETPMGDPDVAYGGQGGYSNYYKGSSNV